MVICKSFNEIRNERKLLALDKLRQYVANWGNPTASCFNPSRSCNNFKKEWGLCANTDSFGMDDSEYKSCVTSWSGFDNFNNLFYPVEGGSYAYYYDSNKWGFDGAIANSERRLDFAKHMINCLEVMIEDLRKEL